MCVYVYIYISFCCAAEIGTLYINYMVIKKKKRGPFLWEVHVGSRISALELCIVEGPGDGCRNKSVPFSAFCLLPEGSPGTGHSHGAQM